MTAKMDDRDITASRQAEEAVRRTRESLEMRVDERTAELSHANRLLKDQIVEREHAEAALRHSEQALREAVTETKLDAERLHVLRAELSHASRLAALGALAGGIAHEINQPLSIVAIWAEVAAREIREKWADDGQEVIRALDRIAAAVERAGRIVERMKSFTRKSGPRVTTVALVEAIDEVRPFIEHSLRMSGATLDVEVQPATAAVLADRIQLQQLLLNLIRNALEAMQGTDPCSRRLDIRGEVQGDLLAVAVRDAGCGIRPDDLECVFDPFHTTKPEGLGLGLSICRTIVETHGGRIWAAANADRGATINFSLPIG